MVSKAAKKAAEFLVTPEGKKFFQATYAESYADWFKDISDGFSYPTDPDARRQELKITRWMARESAMSDTMSVVFDHLGFYIPDWESDYFDWLPKAAIERATNAERLAKTLDRERIVAELDYPDRHLG